MGLCSWFGFRRERKKRHKLTDDFADLVFDSWALHYAKECHAVGDDEGALRWLARMTVNKEGLD